MAEHPQLGVVGKQAVAAGLDSSHVAPCAHQQVIVRRHEKLLLFPHQTVFKAVVVVKLFAGLLISASDVLNPVLCSWQAIITIPPPCFEVTSRRVPKIERVQLLPMLSDYGQLNRLKLPQSRDPQPCLLLRKPFIINSVGEVPLSLWLYVLEHLVKLKEDVPPLKLCST